MEAILSGEQKSIDEIIARLFLSAYKTEEKVIARASDHDLSISEFHVLREVGPNSDRTMTQVARRLKISVSALTIAMNKLEGKGYVIRLRNEADRRIVKLQLTEKGLEALKTHDLFHLDMLKEALAVLTEEETHVLHRSLVKLDEFFIRAWNDLTSE
ncbi:MAG: MarR family transcriptional regulator [Clostridiales Family XIII bacterium]|jgi:DNA-binding MarR family transcriptional regulator|nr:MarR family transcriptional regulator [Clostridiales Family XIII bacterium]